MNKETYFKHVVWTSNLRLQKKPGKANLNIHLFDSVSVLCVRSKKEKFEVRKKTKNPPKKENVRSSLPTEKKIGNLYDGLTWNWRKA